MEAHWYQTDNGRCEAIKGHSFRNGYGDGGFNLFIFKSEEEMKKRRESNNCSYKECYACDKFKAYWMLNIYNEPTGSIGVVFKK